MSKCIVIDTNVFISALRSKRGASYKLIMAIGSGLFDMNISVPLILEYEGAAKRLIGGTKLTSDDIDDIIDYICSVAGHWKVFYLWRPFLRDPKDDMVLELAVASESDFIISYNKKDFHGSENFGIKVFTPKEFLKKIGGI
jgi:putative PIN family toxin of toxin-antitoxin system